MGDHRLVRLIDGHVHSLCVDVGNRHVGSPGNRAATDLFRETVATLGFDVEEQAFDCMEWEHGEVGLVAGDESFEAEVGPYSLPCDVTAPLVSASTDEELESVEATGRVLLLHGEVAREQVMPKNFVFYNPDRHRRIVARIEEIAPAVVIAATGRDPGLAGGQYPFPMFEDGDLDVPTVVLRDVEGERLLPRVGEPVRVTLESRRIPARGCNVVATRPGREPGRVVLCAHIDAKKGTPGALDNATGVATILAVARLLHDVETATGVEIVALNGEDDYAASGQMLWLERNRERMDDVRLAINLDLAGCAGVPDAFSFYGCDDATVERVRAAIAGHETLVVGEPWYQGDHMIFVQAGRPAIAVASENLVELSTEVTHTPRDVPDLVDARKLADLARVLVEILRA